MGSRLPSMTTVTAMLDQPWSLGTPEAAGALVAFPLFGGGTPAAYMTFGRAVASGAVAKELPEGPSVNDIVVDNPTGSVVLLLDGEEVQGAQQNRVFDGSVLVPARSEVRVAVCCVEQGRWDGRARHERFRSSPQVAHPGLRSAMARVHDRGTGRTDQGEVWAHVASRIAETGTMSTTTAMADVYTSRQTVLDDVGTRIGRRDGQRGVLAFIGERFVALDWFSNEEAYAEMHPRLIRGYALDAVDAPSDLPVPPTRKAKAVLEAVMALPLEAVPGTGAGRRLRGRTRREEGGLHASALDLDGRLAQLSVLAA